VWLLEAGALECVLPNGDVCATMTHRGTWFGEHRHPTPEPHQPRCIAESGTGPSTSAPGLGSPPPRLHCDWAHPCHVYTGTASRRRAHSPRARKDAQGDGPRQGTRRRPNGSAQPGIPGYRVEDWFPADFRSTGVTLRVVLFCLFACLFVCRQISSLLYRMRGPHFVSLFDALPDALSELKRKLQVGFPLADARRTAVVHERHFLPHCSFLCTASASIGLR
jgi:hypothetical protein